MDLDVNTKGNKEISQKSVFSVQEKQFNWLYWSNTFGGDCGSTCKVNGMFILLCSFSNS